MYISNDFIIGVFRSLGAKPTKEEMSKKKTKRFWWIREIFFCFCTEKKKNDFMDIIQDGEKDGRVSRATIMSETSTIGRNYFCYTYFSYKELSLLLTI